MSEAADIQETNGTTDVPEIELIIKVCVHTFIQSLPPSSTSIIRLPTHIHIFLPDLNFEIFFFDFANVK